MKILSPERTGTLNGAESSRTAGSTYLSQNPLAEETHCHHRLLTWGAQQEPFEELLCWWVDSEFTEKNINGIKLKAHKAFKSQATVSASGHDCNLGGWNFKRNLFVGWGFSLFPWKCTSSCKSCCSHSSAPCHHGNSCVLTEFLLFIWHWCLGKQGRHWDSKIPELSPRSGLQEGKCWLSMDCSAYIPLQLPKQIHSQLFKGFF